MPVEIRELVIKTEISVNDRNQQTGLREEDVKLLKKQLLEECKKMISEKTKKSSYTR